MSFGKDANNYPTPISRENSSQQQKLFASREREWLPFHMHQPGWGVGQTWCEILLLERAKVVSPKTASTSFPGIVEAASERTSVLGEEVKKLLNDIPPQQHHHQHDLVGGEREGWAMWCVFLHFHTTVVFYEL